MNPRTKRKILRSAIVAAVVALLLPFVWVAFQVEGGTLKEPIRASVYEKLSAAERASLYREITLVERIKAGFLAAVRAPEIYFGWAVAVFLFVWPVNLALVFLLSKP